MITHYSERMERAVAGLVSTMRPSDSITRNCATEAGIPFGVAVSQGAEDRDAVLGGTSSGFLGISIRDVTLEPDVLDTYRVNRDMGVLVSGDIWVVVGGDVDAGQPAYFNGTTGVISADSGGNQAIAGSRFMTSAASGTLAKLWIR